jgi:hypothetical protein
METTKWLLAPDSLKEIIVQLGNGATAVTAKPIIKKYII